MIHPPTSYTLRKKFLDSLPYNLIEKMIEKGASPDLAKLSKMVKTVEHIEDNRALANFYIVSSKKTQQIQSPYLNKRSRME